MNRQFYREFITKHSGCPNKCRCKEKVSRKRKVTNRSKGRPVSYPDSAELRSKTFQIKYENNLSSIAKLLLNSFQNKYLYYAIDDILYTLKSNSIEQETLLAILYSPVLSLQNNLSINFFDIWIHEIYIDEIMKTNKFLSKNAENFEPFYYITIKFLYRPPVPIRKKEYLW